MISEVHEAGDNNGGQGGELIQYKELREELARLRENDRERQERMKQLVRDNDKIKDHLKALEHLLICTPDSVSSPKSSKSGNLEKESRQGDIHLKNHQLTKTLIKLTCECIVINKKFKYLRRLMKLNHKKLTEIETVAKIGMENHRKTVEDKTCQVVLGGETEKSSVSVGTAASQERLEEKTSDPDLLLSDVFYLPTRPDLPDLRLFDLL